MFPLVALVTPLFQLFTNIGWMGTYQALIIPDISFVLPLTIYTLTAFFTEMPWDLEEAARIDGCTPGQAFRKVILPLAAPGLFTTAILAFIASWNEFLLASQLSSVADPAGHRGDRRVHRSPAAPGALHHRDGGRHDRDRAADHHGAAVPEADRLRSHRRRREGLTARWRRIQSST